MPLTPEQIEVVRDAKREGISLRIIFDYCQKCADVGMISRAECLDLMARYREEWERNDG
jgi:hypothetical protein